MTDDKETLCCVKACRMQVNASYHGHVIENLDLYLPLIHRSTGTIVICKASGDLICLVRMESRPRNVALALIHKCHRLEFSLELVVDPFFMTSISRFQCSTNKHMMLLQSRKIKTWNVTGTFPSYQNNSKGNTAEICSAEFSQRCKASNPMLQ